MSLNLASALILGISLGAASDAPDDLDSPSVNGEWQLIVCMADGVPLRLHALEDTEIRVTDGVMTFPFFFGPPAVLDTRKLHFQFVENGLDVTYPGTRHAAPLKGAWSMGQEIFQFCYATDERLGRPELRAGKGLIYVRLKRSTRHAERSTQQALSQAVAQLQEIVREHGSTEAGKKAKEVLATLGYTVWCNTRVYPTGTPIFTIPFSR